MEILAPERSYILIDHIKERTKRPFGLLDSGSKPRMQSPTFPQLLKELKDCSTQQLAYNV